MKLSLNGTAKTGALAALVAMAVSHAAVVQASAPTAKSASGAGHLEVELVEADTTDKDSADVINALKKLLHGLAMRDAALVGTCLSDDVTVFDVRNNRFIYGKDSVLEHVKKNVIGTDGTRPVKRLVVYRPFVHVKGDMAMVSFKATKEMGGDSPTTLESWCSEIYERKNGEWRVFQLNTRWQPAKKSS